MVRLQKTLNKYDVTCIKYKLQVTVVEYHITSLKDFVQRRSFALSLASICPVQFSVRYQWLRIKVLKAGIKFLLVQVTYGGNDATYWQMALYFQPLSVIKELDSLNMLCMISQNCQYVIVLKRQIQFRYSQNYTAPPFSVAVFL